MPPLRAVIAQVMDRVRAGNAADSRLAALTDREREVLDCIADGLTNRQIGEQLYLAEKTVKNYVSSLLGKLGMERRTQAALFAADVRRFVARGKIAYRRERQGR